MHRIAKLIIVPALMLLGLLAAPSFAEAKGLATFQCPVTKVAQVDPIRNWSPDPNAMSAHGHTAEGNNAFAANSTTAMFEGSGTTCRVKSLKVAFWQPTMISATGIAVMPKDDTTYRLDSLGPGPVTKPPNGLRFIFGSPTNTNPNATAGQWSCTGVASPVTMTIPTSCPPGATGVHAAVYPHFGCWDGQNLGPGLGESGGPVDAISHVRLPANCPLPGVRIPRPSFILKYPLSAVGGHLSSDQPGQLGGTTLHVDDVAVSGQDASGRDFATELNDKCLNVIPDSAPPIGNVGVTCSDNAAGQLKRASDGLVVLEGEAPTAPPFLFEDSFDGDLSKWTVMGGAPSTSAGELVLPNTYPQSRVRAAETFNFEGLTVTALGVDAPVGANNDASKDRALVIEDTTNATQKIMFKISESKLFCQVSPGTQTFVTYDPVAHANLRVREDAGTLYWEASPDGAAWSVVRQVAAPSWVTTHDSLLDIRSGAYYANGHDPASATRVDRVTLG